jgi:hypothetical protein
MVNVAFVFCREAMLGSYPPINAFSQENFYASMELLKKGNCDLIYIALDQMYDGDRASAKEFFENYLERFEPSLKDRVMISASSKPYMEMFIGFIGNFHHSTSIGVNIFAAEDDKKIVADEIDSHSMAIYMEMPSLRLPPVLLAP